MTVLACGMATFRSQARALRDLLKHPSWRGECPICEAPTRFIAYGEWWRDDLLCARCRSLPRERALMAAIETMAPDWRRLAVHESSPADRSVSAKLKAECPGYIATQYDTSVPFGARHPQGYRSENLEAQTFPDAVFDLVLTQDVFEHLFDPAAAIREIARTLKPGGLYVMTVPIVNKDGPTVRRAELGSGQVIHHLPAEFHGNPIDASGSLVTIDWGFDIASTLTEASGMETEILPFDDRSRGLVAEYMEVVACRKP